MATKIVFTLCLVIATQAQVPGFGRCPEYDAMADFNKEKFLGRWIEIERYFTVSEVISKCISVDYERRADGNIHVKNYYTNRINNVQRIISGKIIQTAKSGEGKIIVGYESFPLNYNATLDVLETDYKNFAVIWSCSNIGPIGHTESVWLMARERYPRGEILQAAYGVLDKYKMNRAFFVKTDQENCETLPPPQEAVDPLTQRKTVLNDFDKITVNAENITMISENLTLAPENEGIEEETKNDELIPTTEAQTV